VTTGFTAGIAVVIATLQLKDLFGLAVAHMPEHFPDKVVALWSARGTVSPADLGVGAATLALLVWLPRLTRRVPAPLLALAIVTVLAWAMGLTVDTLGTRFHTVIDGRAIPGIPSLPPAPALPWGGVPLTLGMVRELLPAAFAIAILGAIESLLSAVVADGMTGKRHDPDAELVGQGLANIVAPFFGGIAATGALARTATNIRAGARSPIAAVVHAAVVLGSMVVLAPLLAYLPMASLAALLLLIAWNMAELRHIAHMVRVAPRSDILVLVVCFVLTVAFDMVVAVSVGIVLAALLFMRRMAEITHARVLQDDGAETDRTIPAGVALQDPNDVWPFAGTVGVATTDLKPGGEAQFPYADDRRATSVVSDSGYVEAGTKIVVREARRFRVVVRPVA